MKNDRDQDNGTKRRGSEEQPLCDDKGAGRHRGECKTEQEQLSEDKAKGHLGKPQGEQPGEQWGTPDVNRGPQKGYGKNQGKQSVDPATEQLRGQGTNHG